MLAAHNIPGSSATAKSKRKNRTRFSRIRTNNTEGSSVFGNELSVKVGVTVGKFIYHAQGAADEISVPQQEFTQLVAVAFYNEVFGRDPQ